LSAIHPARLVADRLTSTAGNRKREHHHPLEAQLQRHGADPFPQRKVTPETSVSPAAEAHASTSIRVNLAGLLWHPVEEPPPPTTTQAGCRCKVRERLSGGHERPSDLRAALIIESMPSPIFVCQAGFSRIGLRTEGCQFLVVAGGERIPHRQPPGPPLLGAGFRGRRAGIGRANSRYPYPPYLAQALAQPRGSRATIDSESLRLPCHRSHTDPEPDSSEERAKKKTMGICLHDPIATGLGTIQRVGLAGRIGRESSVNASASRPARRHRSIQFEFRRGSVLSLSWPV